MAAKKKKDEPEAMLVPCYICNGTGEYPYKIRDVDNRPITKWWDCGLCHGRGTIREDE